MNTYKVYYKGSLMGKTTAVSPLKAINNIRYRCNLRYAKMNEFYVKEA